MCVHIFDIYLSSFCIYLPICVYLHPLVVIYLQEFTRAFARVRLHLFIQGYTLILIPVAVSILVLILENMNVVNPLFLKGLV